MHPIFERLKERKIVQWALAYVAGAIAVYSALDALAEPWGIGDAQLRIIQVVLFVGFVAALVTAWYHGERGEQRVTGVELLLLAALAGLCAIGIRLVTTGPAPAAPTGSYAEVQRLPRLAPNHAPLADFEFGPEGTGFTYALRAAGGPKWYRRWDELVGRPIEGSLGGNNYVSPDGRYMVETTRGSELRVISLEGGNVLRREMEIWGGATWGGDGYLYFPGPDSTIHRVSESLQGPIEPVGIPLQVGDVMQRFYQLLPGGRRAVMWVDADPDRIVGCDTRSKECVHLAEGTQPRVTTTGHLVYAGVDGRIMAAVLDASGLEVGPAISVIDGGASFEASGVLRGISWSLSSDGRLGYWEAAPTGSHHLVSVGASGPPTPLDPGWSFEAGNPPQWALSPDGTRIAFKAIEGENQIWMRDLQAGTTRPLTSGPPGAEDPEWLSDTLVAFVSGTRVMGRRPDGAGSAVVLYEDALPLRELEIGPEAEWFVLRRDQTRREGAAVSDSELIAVRRSSPSEALPLLNDPNENERQVAISPDGRWVAYVAGPTGRPEVNVRPFPDVSSSATPISPNVGINPVWDPDGRTLYYVAPESGSRAFVAARFEIQSGLRVVEQDTLFEIPAELGGTGTQPFTLASEPGRVVVAALAAEDRQVVVIRNWFETLKRLLPN